LRYLVAVSSRKRYVPFLVPRGKKKMLMKTLLAMILLLSVPVCMASTKSSGPEQEILKIHKGFDEAFVKGDAAYFERYFAPEYTYSNNFGVLFSRTENLDFLRTFATKPPYKILANTSDNVKVKVNGNAALLTADWTTTALSIDDPNAQPHTDTGRYTAFYEKRDGHWLVVAEHMSEKNHDPKLMEQQVLKAGREYNELIKRLKNGRSYADSERSGDIGALNRVLADEYTCTSFDGEILSKVDNLESYNTNQDKIASADVLEQQVRIISNYTAIEIGKIRYVGSNVGKAYDITKRFTMTWIWRDFRWQIAADHSSIAK
jgi:hypothetical protein